SRPRDPRPRCRPTSWPGRGSGWPRRPRRAPRPGAPRPPRGGATPGPPPRARRGGERPLARACVFFEPGLALGARDRDDVAPAREQPGERELPRGAFLLLRHVEQRPHEVEVLLEVLVLEARVIPTAVVGRDLRRGVGAPGEEAAAERGVGDERDAELAQDGQRLLRLHPVE